MMDGYTVMRIPKEQTYEWLLKKHYAKRIPPISVSFGLYDELMKLCGCCCFGYPCRKLMEYWGNIYELNRLVVKKGLKKNSLSYFVSQSLKLLSTPLVTFIS